jgi:hypothetical protein
LKEWAASQGVAYVTARRQHAAGTLPVPTYRLGRLIMVGEPLAASATAGQVVVYAGVSSVEERSDLDRQVARVTVWATGQKLAVSRVVTEVGSVLDGHGSGGHTIGRWPGSRRSWISGRRNAHTGSRTAYSLRRCRGHCRRWRKAWNVNKADVAPWWKDSLRRRSTPVSTRSSAR